MIILYGGGPNFGLPETSPYVTKTEVQLRMAGLEYRKEPGSPAQSPKSQLPFIDDDGDIVADSTFVRAHIERKYRVDLDAGLDDRQRAEAWAIERMVENHLGWCVGYARFFIPENFAKGPARFFDHAPAEERERLQAAFLGRVRDAFMAVGVLRHSPEEIEDLGERSLQTLSLVLGEKAFLMASRPTGVDAVCFAVLAALQTSVFQCPLRRRSERYPNLWTYVDRMMARFYPEFEWRTLRRAA